MRLYPLGLGTSGPTMTTSTPNGRFTNKEVITPDSEEGGIITPDFTTPVKGDKISPASIFLHKNVKDQWVWQTFKMFFLGSRFWRRIWRDAWV